MRRWIVGVGAAGALMVAFLFLTGADVIRRGVTTVYNLMYRCGGTGCVSRPIASKLGDVVSVKDFGATCDGVANDTTALINANTAAVAASRTLVINCKMRIASAAGTISAPLLFEGNGALDYSNASASVTLTGSFTAPVSQVFFPGSGTLSFTAADAGQTYPQWWGAVADGVTDDTAALQAAINASSGKVVWLPGGPGTKYIATSTLTISNANTTLWLDVGANLASSQQPVISVAAAGVTIVGSGQNSSITVSGLTNDGITTTSAANSLTIRDLVITCGNGTSRTAGAAVRLTGISAPVMHHVVIQNPWDGIVLSGVGNGSFADILISNSYATQSLHDGVYLTNSSIQNGFYNVNVGNAGVNTTAIEAGFVFGKDTDTVYCGYCAVGTQGAGGGATYGFWFKNEAGFSHPPRWIKIEAPLTEVNHTAGVAFQFDHAMSVGVFDAYSAWGQNNVNISSNNVTDVKFIGGQYLLASQYGFLLNAGTRITLDGVTVSDSGQLTNNTYYGVILANSGPDHVTISNSTIGQILFNGTTPASASNFMADAIFVGSGLNNYTITGNDLKTLSNGFGITNSSLAGSNAVVANNRLRNSYSAYKATGQTANLAAQSLYAAAPAGLYRVCATALTTTSGTGTTANLNIIWTDEGGVKTDAVGTWALNSVTVTGQINKCETMHANGAIQVSVTAGTYGTSVYAIYATVEQLN